MAPDTPSANESTQIPDSHGVPAGVRVVKASEFKAKCLQLMDEVAASGEEIVITKRGRPVSRLAPFRIARSAPFGRDREKIQIHGDIIEPIDVEWEADTDPDRVLNP
jgi:prevent-host-death family protein